MTTEIITNIIGWLAAICSFAMVGVFVFCIVQDLMHQYANKKIQEYIQAQEDQKKQK